MNKRPWTTLKHPAEIRGLFRAGERLQTKGLYCRFLLLNSTNTNRTISNRQSKDPLASTPFSDKPVKLLLGAQAKAKHQVSKNRTKRILRAHINELQQNQGMVSRLKQDLGVTGYSGVHLAIIGSEHFSHKEPAERTAQLQKLIQRIHEQIQRRTRQARTNPKEK